MLHQISVDQITRQFKAAFFDLDGTLFDSEPLHAQALVKACEQLGINLEGIDPLHDFLGKPDPAVYRFFHATKMIPQGVSQDNFINAKNSHYLANCKDIPSSKWDDFINPGTRELLKILKDKGILVAIVSASEEAIVKSMISNSGIELFFDHLIARGQCFRSKPSPGPYLSALRHWGLKGHEAIVFEDSPTGQKAAVLAGCELIRVKTFTPQANDNLEAIDNFFRLIS